MCGNFSFFERCCQEEEKVLRLHTIRRVVDTAKVPTGIVKLYMLFTE